jgi:DNA-binding NtrC family response regulator
MNIKNLLFVDDDKSARRYFMVVCKTLLNLDIEVAENYENALEKIKKTDFDLIISDGLYRV